ncbi:MAG: T9SS type A sorting domain-containing protein, partial [Phaeodactylibacter sp.]|nr:T9SS type A sorting domain-containing protein [Phaeodactylibacter sp.]
IGSHAFIIQASDGCGNNPASATLPFEVVDCQPPAFTCYSGLSFGLSSLPPNTDLDGDGINDAAGAAVWASDLILNASDCSDDTIAYSINLAGEAPDIGQQVLYFTCEDTGTIAVQVYVWDSAYNPYAVQPDGSVGGPNYSICDTYVTIQDSTACNGGLLGPMMAGLIAREDNMGVENVEVSLSGPQSLMMLSEVDGTYQFDNLDTGYDYTLSPYLNTDHRNGISTFDLLIIQQHLLGVQPLDSPYKRIAADANHSGNITTLDMIQIQQLILGEILEFPNNTSWRFVDKAFVFPVPTNPWFTPFPEVISVNNLSYPMMANDFVAIKIGDVNNSAVTTGLMGVDGRSFDGTFYLEAPQLELKKGEVAAVPFSARELEAIRGCQFTLDFDPGRVELTDVEYGLADENSIGFHGLADGFLTVSWYRKGGVSYPEGEPLFTLFFRAKENTNLKDLLSISSRYTLAEAYTPGQELLDVALRFGSGRQEEEGGVFRLYQNRPNPFSEESAIGFELPESGAATLSVFDLNGRLLYRKQDLFDKGYNELILKREGLRHLSGAGGVLYYKLQMGNRVATRKMIILE